MPPDVASPDKVETRSGTPTPPKIHELLTLLADPKSYQVLTLLADPKVKEWLEGQGEAKTAAGTAQQTDNSVAGYLNSRAGAIHEQILALARAIPDLPNQFTRAAARVTAVHREHGGGIGPSSDLLSWWRLALAPNGCSGKSRTGLGSTLTRSL